MNKRVLLGILLIVCSAGIATPIGIIIIFWEYFKKAVKIDFYTIYLILRIFVWALIQLPLGVLKVSTEGISKSLHGGISMLRERPKTSAVFFTLSLSVAFFLLPGPGSIWNYNNMFSLSMWASSFKSFLWLIFFSVLSTILLDTLYATLSSGQIARLDVRETSASDHYEGMREGFESAAGTSEDARGVYRDLDPESATDELVDVFKFWERSDIKATVQELAELLPGASVSGRSAGAETAEKVGAEAAESIEMGTVGWVFALALIFLVVQWILVIAVVGVYLQAIIPMIAGPVFGALGLGSDYGNYLGGEVADRYLAGLRVNADKYIDPMLEARQRVYCLLEGPACMRQWRLNNTRNPGSDAVGEQYLLSIDRFEVGSGDRLDIAYKDGGYKVPTSFGLKNSRNGLKGINALNVSYRIRVIDFDKGRDDPFCDTGWTPVSGFDIREDSAEGRFKGNDLYPGTAANTNFLTLDEFNLKNCGLLQPGAGETRTVILDVKYDYFSQATLYFDAMAQETLLSDPSIEKDWKKSETADTPVKSSLNVNSPVLFDQSKIGSGDASQPFSMRTTLFTEERNIEYKIKDLRVRKSSQVEIATDTNQDCQLESAPDGGENVLVPSDNAPGIVESQNSDETRWYDSTNSPPFFGCIMELKNIGSISPEGETLTMGVASNYTLKLEEPLERFRVLNTRCTEFNCPLLVTMSFAESQENKDNWKYKCEGPDAGRTGGTAGCSVVQGDPGDWSTVREDLMTGNDALEKRIERGEIAIDPFQYDVLGGPSYNLTNIGTLNGSAGKTGKVAVGLTEDEIGKLENDYHSRFGDINGRGFALVSYLNKKGERDVEIKELEYVLCRQKEDRKKYARYLAQTRYLGQEPAWVAFSPAFTDCGSEELWDSFGEGFKSEQKIRPSILFSPYAFLLENTVRGLKEEYDNMAEQYKDLSCENGDGNSFKVYDPDEGLKCIGGEENYPEQDSSEDES